MLREASTPVRVWPNHNPPANDGSHKHVRDLGERRGYQSLTICQPSVDTSVVSLLNTDITVSLDGGKTLSDPSAVLGQAIATVLTPDKVFSLPGTPVPTG